MEIFEEGGLEPIIKLLSSTDCDVQVLANLSIYVALIMCTCLFNIIIKSHHRPDSYSHVQMAANKLL